MTDSTPVLCCTHGDRIDRILDLLEDRKAKREPADGVYQVTIPPASRAWIRAEVQEVEAQRADGTYDETLMPAVVERLAKAAQGFPDLRHAATFRPDNSDSTEP